jgi:hypothetical protein
MQHKIAKNATNIFHVVEQRGKRPALPPTPISRSEL